NVPWSSAKGLVRTAPLGGLPINVRSTVQVIVPFGPSVNVPSGVPLESKLSVYSPASKACSPGPLLHTATYQVLPPYCQRTSQRLPASGGGGSDDRSLTFIVTLRWVAS